MSITGNGNATKEQVAKMLQSLSLIKEIPKNLDATDGLAAVCHFYNQGRSDNSKNYLMEAFISQNPKKNKVGLMAGIYFHFLSVAKPVIIVISIFYPNKIYTRNAAGYDQ